MEHLTFEKYAFSGRIDKDPYSQPEFGISVTFGKEICISIRVWKRVYSLGYIATYTKD